MLALLREASALLLNTTLTAVKTEFGKFGEVIEKVQKKFQEAGNAIESAASKTRTIQRKLKTV